MHSTKDIKETPHPHPATNVNIKPASSEYSDGLDAAANPLKTKHSPMKSTK